MTEDQARKLIEQNIDAFARQDWNTFQSQLADGVIYEEEGTGQRCEGAQAFAGYCRGWKQAFPDMVGHLKSLFVSGDSAVGEIEWTGTHQGVLEGRMGRLEPTGRPAKIFSVQVIRFDGERIAEMRHYFDMLSLLGQLGVLPGKAAAAEEAPPPSA